MQKRNWEKAIREYQKLVDDDGKDVRSQLKIADLYVKSGQTPRALESYRQVAYHYFRDEVYDKAVAIFKMAISHDPEDPQLRRDLGESYHRLGRLKDALREFGAAQRVYRQREDFTQQRDVLESMVRIDPEDVGLRVQLAERYEKDGMRDEAVGLLTYAAKMLDEEGRLDEFLRVAERIIFLKPSALDLRKKVARSHLLSHAPKRALKHLQYCFQTSPRDVDILQMLSQAFEAIGQRDKAALVCRELAHVYHESGQDALAQETYHLVLRLNPDDPEAHKMLAYEAERRLRQALPPRRPLVPQDPQPQVSEVEFLDDDLEDELGQMRVSEEVDGDVTQLPGSMFNPSRQTASLADFARDELGDLAQSESLPLMEVEAMPLIEAEPLGLEFDPQADRARDIKQVLDESDIFLKYNLHDKAIQALHARLKAYPDALELRERLAHMYAASHQPVLAADQLLECAKLPGTPTALVSTFVERAGDLLGDPLRARQMAQAAGLIPEDTGVVEPPETLDFNLMEDSDLGSIFEQLQAQAPPLRSIVSPPPQAAGTGDPAEEVGGDLSHEFDPLEEDITGEFMLPDSEILEMDSSQIEFLEDDEFHQVELEEVGSSHPSAQGDATVTYAAEEDLTFDLGESEAESMFEELFSDEGQTIHVNASFSGAQDLAGIAELDFLIDQGMMDEAEDALGQLQSQNPSSQTLQTKLRSLQDRRESGGSANAPHFAPGTNPFGSRSLSQQFHYTSPKDLSPNGSKTPPPGTQPVLLPEGLTDTHFDLGLSYMDLGLYDEAMDELRQVLQDPQVGPYALYSLALCESRRGSAAAAKYLLKELLAMPHASPKLQTSAHALMARVS